MSIYSLKCYLKYCIKRCVFRPLLNELIVCWLRRVGGREFHSLGAADENARSPYVEDLGAGEGYARRLAEDERSVRDGRWI